MRDFEIGNVVRLATNNSSGGIYARLSKEKKEGTIVDIQLLNDITSIRVSFTRYNNGNVIICYPIELRLVRRI